MTREELIGYCRYYKGEDEDPFEREESNRGLMWFYESRWIEMKLSESERNYLIDNVASYSYWGLSKFSVNDGTPVSLKSILFNRYEHWLGYSLPEDIKGFKEFYIEDYIRNAKHQVPPSSTEHIDDEMSPFDMHIFGVYGALKQGVSEEEALREYNLSRQEYGDNINRCLDVWNKTQKR